MARDEDVRYLRSLEQPERRVLMGRSFGSGGGGLSVSATIAAGQNSLVNTGPINFTVTFNQPATGFTNSDVSFTGSTVGGTLAAAVTGTGPTYNVAVSGMTGNGIVAVSIPAASATNAVGKPFPSSSTATVTYDTTRPSVTIDVAAGQIDPTVISTVNFTAVFSEPVTGFIGTDVTIAGTAGGTKVATVSGGPSTYNVAISGLTTTGTVVASLAANVATDYAGNLSLASTSTDNSVQFTPSAFVATSAGINYPWNAFAADFGTGGFGHLYDLTKFTSDLTMLAGQRVKLVRWWLMGDGRYCPTFDGSGAVTGLNSGFLADLDTVLALGNSLDIKFVFSLIDQIMFGTAEFSGTVQLGGHEDIIKNSTRRQLYLDLALKPILQHVAASPFADRVLMWDICNEPEGQIAGGYNGFDFFMGSAQFALSDVQTFVQMCATYIHTYGGVNAKATVGAAIPVWCPLWVGLGLDYHQAHYYNYMDALTGVPGSGLTAVADITKDDGITHLDAPCFLGEFPTGSSDVISYGLSDTAVHSARWYLDTALTRGYVGALAWSLNGGDTGSDWTLYQPVYTDFINDNFPAAGVASVAFQAGATAGGSGPYSIAVTVASAAGAERLVMLCGIANGTAATVTFSGVTIGGQAATQVGAYARAPIGSGGVLSFWRASGTASTTINVVATASGAMFDLRCAVWTLTNAGTLFASTVVQDNSATATHSFSVNTTANGVVAAATIAFNSGTVSSTWSGLSERFDGFGLYGNDAVGGADTATASASTPLAISTTHGFASTFSIAGLALAFNHA